MYMVVYLTVDMRFLFYTRVQSTKNFIIDKLPQMPCVFTAQHLGFVDVC